MKVKLTGKWHKTGKNTYRFEDKQYAVNIAVRRTRGRSSVTGEMRTQWEVVIGGKFAYIKDTLADAKRAALRDYSW